MNDFAVKLVTTLHRSVFRASKGKLLNRGSGMPVLMLTTTGRKSGRAHTTPMVYTPDGDRLLVYASKGGAPKHPDWFLNLVADSHVVIEVGGDRYDAIATPLAGEERDRQFSLQARDSVMSTQAGLLRCSQAKRMRGAPLSARYVVIRLPGPPHSGQRGSPW